MDRVKSKVAIITGGASGLGKSSAILLAREGAKIVITDLDEENGNEVVQQIKDSGGEAIFIRQDVSKEEEWESVIDRTLKTYGKLHVLANAAGIGVGGNVEEVTLADWKKLLSINLDGTFLGTQYGIKAMRTTGEGDRSLIFPPSRALLATPIYRPTMQARACLLYTSDAADDLLCVDLGGRRIIKKK